MWLEMLVMPIVLWVSGMWVLGCMFEVYLGLAVLEQLLVELNSEQSISLHPHSHTHTPHMRCTRHDVDSVFQVTVSDQCASMAQ